MADHRADRLPPEGDSLNYDGNAGVRFAQIEQIFSQARAGMFGALVGAAILTVMLWGAVSGSTLLVWLLIFLAFQFFRHMVVSGFHREHPVGKDRIAWGKWFVIGSVGTAALWGSAALLLFPVGSFPHQCLLALVLGGVAASTATAQAPLRECYVASVLLIMLPLCGRFLYAGNAMTVSVAIMGMVFAGVLIWTGSYVHAAIARGIRLGLEKDELVESLRTAGAELESRIAERTAQLTAKNAEQARMIAAGVKIEEELRASRQRFQELVELLPEVVYEIDERGLVTFTNAQGFLMTGYSPSDIEIGLKATDLIIPSDREQGLRNLERLLKGETVGLSSYTVLRKDGTTFPAVARSAPIVREGQIVGIRGVMVDVTEQKRALDSLLESERRYRDLYENSVDALYAHDLDGNYLSANSAVETVLGYPRERFLTLNFRDIVYPEDLAKTVENFRKKVENGIEKTGPYEIRVLTEDGSVRWVEVTSRIVKEAGRPVAVEGSGRDITERKKLEERLRQSAKMEAIGLLAGGIAHDFNNLLTAMMGYAEMLRLHLPSETPDWHRVCRIQRAAESAADLTRQLLAFGRKQVLDARPLILNDVIADFEKMLRRVIGEDVDIVTDLSADLGTVLADAGQVEQILMNLAVNARDAMPNGGVLRIETYNVVLDEDYARSHPDATGGDYVLMTMSDTGSGMDSVTLGRIFDPFFTTKAKGVGTGLGLSTVYGIVKQHQGHLAVYSEPGIGTTFKVYLPRVFEKPDRLPQAAPAAPLPAGDETILVVEDEEIVRVLACDVLDMLGYSVLCAPDPAEALAISDSHDGPIQLLLTDVVLPGMDGRSLFKRLSSSRPELDVLYVSGYTENFIVHHGVLDRGVFFLQKPFTLDGLGHKIREVLDRTK